MINKTTMVNRVACSLMGRPVTSFIHGASTPPEPLMVLERAREKGLDRSMPHVEKVYGPDPLEGAREILQVCNNQETNLVTLWDDLYPPYLREIPDPPLVLYCRGKLPSGDRNIALVGTRHAGERSRSVAYRVAGELAEQGISVVSGMAQGVDSAAHRGALGGGGDTVAVMGTGIDRIFPASNRGLARQMVQEGSAVISEFPPGIRAQAWTFVRRNRIISGLCRAVVVVQAGEKSGALITARFAAEQGREVFCTTGYPFDPGYHGSLKLLSDGARPFMSTRDLVENCGLEYREVQQEKKEEASRPLDDDNSIEATLYRLCKESPWSADAVSRKLAIPVDQVLQAAMMLEIQGMIRQVNGQFYSL